MQTRGKAVYDTCCFGVDSNDKLSDERYMIFYNQPVSPGNAVSMRTEGQDFIYTIDLGKLPGNIVKLQVKDDGEEIPCELAEQMFTPFVRGDKTRSTVGGTGLELSISKKIVEMHSGTLTYKRENGLNVLEIRLTGK